MNTPAAAALQPRTVPAGHGWDWLVGGMSLFRRAPGTWVGMGLSYILILVVTALVPGGSFIASLFGNVFLAGFVLGASSLESGDGVRIEHLFAAFKGPHFGPLVLLALLYFVGILVVIFAVVLVGVLCFGLSASSYTPGHISPDDVLRILLFVLSIIALMIPLAMGIWLAPSLIVLRGLGPVEAFKLSFHACWVNFLPLLVFGLACIPCVLVALLPLGLGLLVLMPVLYIAVYVAYRDIFPPLAAAEPVQPPPLI